MSRPRALELLLTADGGAELLDLEHDERVLWASRDDEEFAEEFPELLDENDAEAVFAYLVECDWLTDEEADDAEFSAEAMNPSGAAELLTADQSDDEEGTPLEGGY